MFQFNYIEINLISCISRKRITFNIWQMKITNSNISANSNIEKLNINIAIS